MTGPLSTPATTTPVTPTSRVASIDLIRGAVMVLMAIDHVRVYSGLPAGGPTAGIFFTRWVTHFVAPAFISLAGTSALPVHESSDGKSTSARGLHLKSRPPESRVGLR